MNSDEKAPLYIAGAIFYSLQMLLTYSEDVSIVNGFAKLY